MILNQEAPLDSLDMRNMFPRCHPRWATNEPKLLIILNDARITQWAKIQAKRLTNKCRGQQNRLLRSHENGGKILWSVGLLTQKKKLGTQYIQKRRLFFLHGEAKVRKRWRDAANSGPHISTKPMKRKEKETTERKEVWSEQNNFLSTSTFL